MQCLFSGWTLTTANHFYLHFILFKIASVFYIYSCILHTSNNLLSASIIHLCYYYSYILYPFWAFKTSHRAHTVARHVFVTVIWSVLVCGSCWAAWLRNRVQKISAQPVPCFMKLEDGFVKWNSYWKKKCLTCVIFCEARTFLYACMLKRIFIMSRNFIITTKWVTLMVLSILFSRKKFHKDCAQRAPPTCGLSDAAVDALIDWPGNVSLVLLGVFLAFLLCYLYL